jgi:hypothetical protein
MVNIMEKTFERVRSIRDIVIFVSLVVLGSILIALPTSASINITGFFLIFAGLILALVLKTGYKDENGGKYQKKERFFQQAMNAEICSAIASKPNSINLSEEDKGNAVRLDIYSCKSSGKAYIQLFEYVPYRYEPCSKIYEYEISEVSNLIK